MFRGVETSLLHFTYSVDFGELEVLDWMGWRALQEGYREHMESMMHPMILHACIVLSPSLHHLRSTSCSLRPKWDGEVRGQPLAPRSPPEGGIEVLYQVGGGVEVPWGIPSPSGLFGPTTRARARIQYCL